MEAIIALALLGIIGVAFLGALATTSNSRLIADEHVTSRILAEYQMENLRKQTYAFSYAPLPVPADYRGYTAVVDIDNFRNGNIQKITVAVNHHNREVARLESYKTNR